jgi:endonuclease/exonuclease/phosphatase family metal-dependent hydrolase
VAEVRVLSYNVRSLRDDGKAVARVIRACEPDIVCVQEAPRFFRWRSKCAALARGSGLYVITGGRTAGAMLLLGSLGTRVVSAEDVLLSKAPGLHQRGLAMAVLDVDGARLGVASMHLSLQAEERERQVEEVLGHLKRLETPHLVLAGDVNESPSRPSWHRLAAELQDGWAVAPWGGEFTSPVTAPAKRIDGIFASPGVEVVRCGVPGVPELARASDHLPVLAVLRVPAGPEALRTRGRAT